MLNRLFGIKNKESESKNKINLDSIYYADVLSVSPYKSMAYMDYGEYEKKLIDNHSKEITLHYIPSQILKQLLDHENVYVMTKKINNIHVPENARLILVDEKDTIGIQGTYVFHLPTLKKLLQMNRGIACRMINLGTRRLTNALYSFNKDDPINDDAVFQFVKIVSKITDWKGPQKALIDACFADCQYIYYHPATPTDKINITENIERFFNEFSKLKDKSNESRLLLITDLLKERLQKNIKI